MSVTIEHLSGVDIRMAEGAWPLPEAMRASVPGRWARMVEDNPNLWDGRILGVSQPLVGADGVLRGEAREDAYSAFLVWREAGFPPIGVLNLFGSALIVSSDGALVFGVMDQSTANPGRVYPPGGSLEPRDVTGEGVVDVLGSVRLELAEETGLDAADARLGELIVAFDGPRISVAQAYHFALPAEQLLAHIRGNLDGQEHRELADVVAVRSQADAAAAGDVVPFAGAIAEAFGKGRLKL
jgi:8-oxo-dGTP pyrophosphatase MutT (NUDIX family)